MRRTRLLAFLALVAAVGCGPNPTPLAPNAATSAVTAAVSPTVGTSPTTGLACPAPFDPTAPTPYGGCGPRERAILAAVADLGYRVRAIGFNPCDPLFGITAACIYTTASALRPDAWVYFSGTDQVAPIILTRSPDGTWGAVSGALQSASSAPSK